MTAATKITGNPSTGTLLATPETDNALQLKNVVDEDTGEETTVIEGFAATTHLDKTQDQFTLEALKSMARDINSSEQETIDAVFPHLEGMEEPEIGNLNHNNNPAAEKLIGAGDTRIVPVFKVTSAEVVSLPEDGEHALQIKGEMMPLPEDLEEAVKAQIRQGGLHSFSIEFSTTRDDVEFVMEDGNPVRRIHDADAQGQALTGRPMNDNAKLTNAQLKNIIGGKTEENNANGENQTMTEEQEDLKAEKDLEGKAADIAAGTDLKEETVLRILRAYMDDEEMNAEHKEEEMKNEEAEEEGEEEEEHEEQEEDDESEEQEQEEETEEEEEDDDGETDLKSELSEIKDQVTQLKTEKEELEEELSDMKNLEGLKNEISEIKNQIEESGVDLEGERPLADQEETRTVKTDADKPQWQRSIDQLGYSKDDLKNVAGVSGKTEAEIIAETHGVKTEEVLDYAE